MNYAPEKLRQILASEIDCEHLQVAGDGRHFETLIVSEAFSGLNRVRRHQLVYAALGDGMKEDIHALSMRLYSPDEWKNLK